jgi:starch synthase
MNILIGSAEIYPYSKTGGLGDMVGALAKALARAGHRTCVVTPLYSGVRERLPGLRKLDLSFEVPLGLETLSGEVWSYTAAPGLTIYFVEQPGFFQRAGLYQQFGVDYPDNAERFIFFSKALTHLALNLPEKPDVVHLHDWQAGPTALLLRHQCRVEGRSAPPICTTIHNLAYQGVFPVAKFPLLNLPWDYFTPDGLEFFGQMNCLKAGIVWSDIVSTVSPTYAREITTVEYGCGLDGLLRHRGKDLHGILNGVDYDEWDPIRDTYLPHRYSQQDMRGKAACKLALQKEFGLPQDPMIPLFGNVGRMVEQKGVDILLGALQDRLQAKLQFVMIGTGAPAYERGFQELAARFPGKAAVRVGFDEALSHRIEAGCDFFVMPSRFEPCGLNQMYSLRYGTIPIARATGGLEDSVIDIRQNAELANGIKFGDFTAAALAKAIEKALALYHEPELLERFRHTGMAGDFSWDKTAREYVRMYGRAMEHGETRKAI